MRPYTNLFFTIAIDIMWDIKARLSIEKWPETYDLLSSATLDQRRASPMRHQPPIVHSDLPLFVESQRNFR